MKFPYDVFILVDTNIFYDDFEMKGKKFQALRHFTGKTNSSVLLPSVLRDELKKKYAENLKKDFDRIGRISKTYDNLIELKKNQEDIQIDYDKRIDGYLYGFVHIDSNKISIKKLLDRSINEKAPFGKSDKGFRDAVIWESAIGHVKKSKSKKPLVIVSGNSSDFGKDNLAPELIEEAKKLGIEVFYYPSIEEMLSKHSIQIDFINEEAVISIVDENQGFLESWAEDSDDQIEIDRYDLDVIEGEVENAEVTGHPTYLSHSTFSFYIYDEDDKYIYVEAEVEIEVEAEIEYEYYEDEYDRDGYNWRERRNGYTTTTHVVNTTVPIKFDKKTREGEID